MSLSQRFKNSTKAEIERLNKQFEALEQQKVMIDGKQAGIKTELKFLEDRLGEHK